MVIKLNSTDVDIENFDPKLSLSYLKALGCSNQSRFTTQDPAGMQGSPNMYAYVGNIIRTTVPMSVGNLIDLLLNLVNKKDPTGLYSSEDMIDGSRGSSKPCYGDSRFLSHHKCLTAGHGYSGKYCDAACEGDPSDMEIEAVGFLECLDVFGTLSIVSCIASLIDTVGV